MYFESAFYRVNNLSTMENEELEEFLKKAADKCNTAPESFYIYPACITDEKVFLVMRGNCKTQYSPRKNESICNPLV